MFPLNYDRTSLYLELLLLPPDLIKLPPPLEPLLLLEPLLPLLPPREPPLLPLAAFTNSFCRLINTIKITFRS